MRPDLSVDGDEALHASDSLVAEHGLLRTIVVSVESEGEKMLIGAVLRSCEELSAHDCDESRRYGHVGLVGEGDCAVVDENSLEERSGLVDQKVHASGHEDEVAVDGRHVGAPGSDVAPPHHVLEGLPDDGDGVADLNDEGVGSWKGQPGADCAGDGSGGGGGDCAGNSVNGDCWSVEVQGSSGKCDGVVTEDIAGCL